MWLHDQCVCKAPEAVGFFLTRSCDTFTLALYSGFYLWYEGFTQLGRSQTLLISTCCVHHLQ